jgi:hypothetical protein
MGFGLHWYSIINHSNWQVNIGDALYGTQSITKEHSKGSVMTAVIDSGIFGIIVPASDFIELQNAWKDSVENLICSNSVCYFKDSCADNFVYFDSLNF